MSTTRALRATVLLAALGLPTALHAQPLGDVAATEGARRATADHPITATTNAELKPDSTTPPDVRFVPPGNRDARFTLWQHVVTARFRFPSTTVTSETLIESTRPITGVEIPRAPWSGPTLPPGVSWADCQRGLVDTVRIVRREWTLATYAGHPRVEGSSSTSFTLAFPDSDWQVLSWRCLPTTP